MKKRILQISAAAFIGMISGAASRADTITTYTDPTAFAAAVQPGSLTDNFAGFGSGVGFASYSNSNAMFGYSASSADSFGDPNTLYGISTTTPALFSTNYDQEALTLTITQGNVTAVGGYFYNTDINNNFLADPVSLTLFYGNGLSDMVTFTPSSIGASYFGFTDTNITSGYSITSIVENAPGAGDYASLSTFTVGSTAVPGPSSLLLSGLAGLCGLACRAGRLRRDPTSIAIR